MKIAIGNDHIVTAVKMRIADFLKSNGHEVVDVGTHDNTRTHYPIYGLKVADLVREHQVDLGVVICGTGVGISTAANKNQGIRAALVADPVVARYAREHLDANVISFGGAVIGEHLAEEIVESFIDAHYLEQPEDNAIVAKIDALEPSNPEQYDNPHFFDHEMALWKQGHYHD